MGFDCYWYEKNNTKYIAHYYISYNFSIFSDIFYIKSLGRCSADKIIKECDKSLNSKELRKIAPEYNDGKDDWSPTLNVLKLHIIRLKNQAEMLRHKEVRLYIEKADNYGSSTDGVNILDWTNAKNMDEIDEY